MQRVNRKQEKMALQIRKMRELRIRKRFNWKKKIKKGFWKSKPNQNASKNGFGIQFEIAVINNEKFERIRNRVTSHFRPPFNWMRHLTHDTNDTEKERTVKGVRCERSRLFRLTSTTVFTCLSACFCEYTYSQWCRWWWCGPKGLQRRKKRKRKRIAFCRSNNYNYAEKRMKNTAFYKSRKAIYVTVI